MSEVFCCLFAFCFSLLLFKQRRERGGRGGRVKWLEKRWVFGMCFEALDLFNMPRERVSANDIEYRESEDRKNWSEVVCSQYAFAEEGHGEGGTEGLLGGSGIGPA